MNKHVCHNERYYNLRCEEYIEEIGQEFEINEALWDKVAKHKLRRSRKIGLTPREWVLSCKLNDFVIRRGRNEALIREHAKQHRSEKVTCEDCGRVVSRGKWSKHVKTAVHLKALVEGNLALDLYDDDLGRTNSLTPEAI